MFDAPGTPFRRLVIGPPIPPEQVTADGLGERGDEHGRRRLVAGALRLTEKV